MPRVDATTASCVVYTFKDGALSVLGHDLELVVERFHIDVGEDLSVDARFDARSLRVRGVAGGGDALSADDRHKIERTIVEEVLDAARYPEISFQSGPVRSRGEDFDLDGTLTLHGRRAPLRVLAQRRDDRLVADVTLNQPEFGIRPFRAMLGALRVRPTVRVRISLPARVAPSAPPAGR